MDAQASSLEEARLRTASVFSDVTSRLQKLRSLVAVKDGPASGAAADADSESDSEDASGKSVDIRGTVTNLLAALEDMVHQVGEHKRVIEVRKTPVRVWRAMCVCMCVYVACV